MRVPQVCLDSLLAKCVSGCSSPMTELINRPYSLTARFAAYRQPFGLKSFEESILLSYYYSTELCR